MTKYRDKLESLGFHANPKKTKTTVVMDDERGGGRVAGKQIEHKDGHVDAVITPPVVDLSAHARINAVQAEHGDGHSDVSITPRSLGMTASPNRKADQ